MGHRDSRWYGAVAGVLLTLLIAAPGRAAMAEAADCATPEIREEIAAGTSVEDRFDYRGRRVQILRRGAGPHAEALLCIDGRRLPGHIFGRVGDGYGSQLLPFQDFREPRDLARALIDNDGVLYQL